MHAKPDGKKHSSVLVDANRKLTFVPVVYFFCRIWGTVRFMVGAHAPDMRDKDNVHWIAPLQVGRVSSGQAGRPTIKNAPAVEPKINNLYHNLIIFDRHHVLKSTQLVINQYNKELIVKDVEPGVLEG